MSRVKLPSKDVTRDRDIRAALLPVLKKKYLHSEQDLALEEFKCNSARADIAVMNGVMHGFEIKSDSDTLFRLSDQVSAYEGVFDLITVVVGRRLLEAVEADLPPHCGIILARLTDGRVRLTHKRPAKKNPNQRPRDLARLLWKSEALDLLRKANWHGVNSRSSANKVWDAVAGAFDIDALSAEVRQAIKLRRGFESVVQSWSDGDLLTTRSTALLDHYSENLAHLLSIGSHRHPD